MSLLLSDLTVPDARLVQLGLKAAGFYHGTTRGRPGPLTKAAYAAYLESLEGPATLPAVADTDPERIPALLVAALQTKLGIREVPRNSNRGPDVEEIQRATWLDGTGWPWCAAFVCWGLLQVSKKIPLPFDRPLTAGAWDFERWARDEKLKLYKPRRKIEAGDIVVFTFSHIGVAIADEKSGYVRTIEGNTDSSGTREGGGVYKQDRRVSLVRSHIRLA